MSVDLKSKVMNEYNEKKQRLETKVIPEKTRMLSNSKSKEIVPELGKKNNIFVCMKYKVRQL